jgi:uncharacterized protein (DUF4415 family)
MSMTKTPDVDYQAYMRQQAPELGQMQRGPTARAARRAVAKSKITIRIDTDIVEQFKQMVADGQGYQRLMNQALREWLMARGVTELVREELHTLMANMTALLQETSRRSC